MIPSQLELSPKRQEMSHSRESKQDLSRGSKEKVSYDEYRRNRKEERRHEEDRNGRHEKRPDEDHRRRRSASPRDSRRRREGNAEPREFQYGMRDERAEEKIEGEGEYVPPPTEAPNFGLSGALAADVNSYRGIVLKYSEPPEARQPTEKYRLYVFKGDEQLDVLHIHRQSAYLIGRERLVADIPIDHPSCSKQHAALQYRQVTSKNEFGDVSRDIKLYIVDLESSNGTFVNGKKIPPTRYYELRVGDVVKFGTSTRDYVLMSEDAAE